MLHGKGRWRQDWRSRSAVVIASAAVLAGATAAFTAAPAGADCSGTHCLPGGGYTFERSWNCGLISAWHICHAVGTLNSAYASRHSWGWGSADYDGSGSVKIAFSTEDFGGFGYNLARACYYLHCGDQSVNPRLAAWVLNQETNGSRHTVYGRAKA